MAEKQDIGEQEKQGGDSSLLDGIRYTGNKGPCWGARHTTILMMALGSSFSFFTNSVFTVVLVAMTNSNTTNNTNIPTYNWDNKKGLILSSNMWLGIPISIIAGEWGKRYGHKWLILSMTALNGVLFMLIPAFASFGGYVGVLFIRLMEGAAMGVLSPVRACINGIWVPAEERSKAGMVGLVITMLTAMISFVAAGQIAASSLGYPACCYGVGILNLLWCVGWLFTGYQNPATHPRITPEERKYIETSLSLKASQNIPTPWRKLLTSVSLWAPIVAGIGVTWMDTLMSSVNLIFITKVWDMPVETSAQTLGIAPFAGIFFGIVLAPLSDFIIKRKIVRIVNARRIFHTVGAIGNALILIVMTFIPAGQTVWIILIMCIMNVFIIMCGVGGANLNILDIAPRFVGVISGYSSPISSFISLFAPMTLDWIVTKEDNAEEWRIIFIITGGIVLVTTIFFNIFATDKRQDWDNEEDEIVETTES